MSFYLSAIMLGLALSAMGLGIFISMRIFNIPDITTDGSYTLGAVVTGILLSKQYPVPTVCLAAFASGAIAGSITGFIHARLKINALLAGILVMTALYSVNLTLLGRSNLPLLETKSIFDYLSFVSNSFLAQLLSLFLFSGFIWFFITRLLKTDFGIAMRATGNSETMARSLGVNTNRMKILGLGLSNGLVALSGFLVAQYQGFADINMGIGIVILGLGSVMIGETLTNWLKINNITLRLGGVIVGSILFRLILAFSLTIGINPNLLKLITACFVLLVVSLPNLKKAS